MSDFKLVRTKVSEGAKWRGSIRVSIDGQEAELAVRQLKDPEFFEVMDMINREELQALRADLPEELMDEFRELQQKDELTEEESERFAELEQELNNNSVSLFDALSTETLMGIRRCAMYAVVPDNADIMEAFGDPEYVNYVESEYGISVKEPKDLYDAEKDGRPDEWAGPLKDEVQKMVQDCTKFTSFTIGIQALVETIGDAKN